MSPTPGPPPDDPPRHGADDGTDVPSGCAASGVVVRRRGVRVLDGVGLAVLGGRIHGLVGPNGAGKTTLLSVLAGRLRPDAGIVRLRGETLSPRLGLAARARRGLGYLAQEPTVFRDLSVWENLCAVPRSDAAEAARVLTSVGLDAVRDARAGSLSGGERRRLEIGRLLLLPSLCAVLCDEPFAGLDPQGVAAVSALLRALADDGIGVLVTDHRVESLFACADEISLLLDGGIRAHGTADEVAAHPAAQARYLASS